MALTLYAHPFSSYSQKVLIALWENAAATKLFYADWVSDIGERFPILRAYRARLLARPSIARAVEEGRPHRRYIPLGAPDRT
jgi:glutathione S-transferase